MKYKSLRVTRHGGPEVLEVVEHELRPSAKGEVRIKVLAASVSRPDVTVRRGEALYRGTWLGQKLPFTPGYAIIGDVEAVGENVRNVTAGARVGVLTVIGGYTEYLYWRADRLIPVPVALDPAEAVPLILNYIVAYQTMMHRVAKVRAGEKALIIYIATPAGAAPWPGVVTIHDAIGNALPTVPKTEHKVSTFRSGVRVSLAPTLNVMRPCWRCAIICTRRGSSHATRYSAC